MRHLVEAYRTYRSGVLRSSRIGLLVTALSVCLCGPTAGDLVFTELMVDTGDNENNWEWIEVWNSGETDIDLDGYFMDRLNDTAIPPTASPNINSANTPVTVVPAGETAVLFNGFRLGYNGARFRDAWQMPETAAVIGVDFFPPLTNGGTAIGFWPSLDDYFVDTEFDVEQERDVVTGFTAAPYSFDYRDGFPRGNNSASMAWNGQGDVNDPANWSLSQVGSPGVRESVPTTIEGDLINSPDDVANPGIVPGGSQRAGLLISEIMYNPAFSGDTPWEWVEIINNTGNAIDFSSGWVFDDVSDSSGAPEQANVTSGTVADGEIAILYDDSLTPEQFAAAWNAEGLTLNLIPVSTFPAISNSGDTIALWDSFAAYQSDRMVSVETTTNAVAAATYSTEFPWISAGQGESIYVLDLDGDMSDPENWDASFAGDAIGSRNAAEVLGARPDHVGGDVGSPGFFDTGSGEATLDFNDDGFLDVADANLLVAAIVAVKEGQAADLVFDVTGDDQVGDDDLSDWLDGSAREVGFLESYLLGDTNLDGTVNFDDFVSLNNRWQQQDTLWIGGDFNADGITDFSDFVSLNNNWQQSIPIQALTAAVPEPSGLAMCLTVIGLFVWRRPR